jgi:hypothetical protein
MHIVKYSSQKSMGFGIIHVTNNYKAISSCIRCRILWYDVVLLCRMDNAKFFFHSICMNDRLFDDHVIFIIQNFML